MSLSSAMTFYVCKYENALPPGPNIFGEAVFLYSSLKHHVVLEKDATNDDDPSHAYWFYLPLL